MRAGLLLMAAMMAVPQGARAADPAPILFPQNTVTSHLLGKVPVVEATDKRFLGGVDLDVRVIVTPDGQVSDARVMNRERYGDLDFGPVVAVARTLRFAPFTYRGRIVTGGGIVSIRYTGAGQAGWRDPQADLPPIDYASLKITLTRSACFGSCPDYKVTIDGAGNVTFSTREESLPGAAQVHRAYSFGGGVILPGIHRSTIDRAALDALIARFRAAHFFGLRKEYRASITDNPTYSLSFESGGQHWTVTDYVGERVGMPQAVSELEDAVDVAAGTARWVRGDENTAAALIAAGLDLKSNDAAMLAAVGDERVALGLIDADLPLDRTIAIGTETMPVARLLLMSAAQEGNPRLMAVLTAKGWLARLPKARLGELLVMSGNGCNLTVTRALIAAGADPNAMKPAGEHDMIGGEDILLIAAARSYRCADAAARQAMVMGLIADGADINARDQNGQTVIFTVEDPELLDRLLAAGARTDFKSKDGNSAAFGSTQDAIVLRLLEAGADPAGRYAYNGDKTMREAAVQEDMPGVLAWLDAHGVK